MATALRDEKLDDTKRAACEGGHDGDYRLHPHGYTIATRDLIMLLIAIFLGGYGVGGFVTAILIAP